MQVNGPRVIAAFSLLRMVLDHGKDIMTPPLVTIAHDDLNLMISWFRSDLLLSNALMLC